MRVARGWLSVRDAAHYIGKRQEYVRAAIAHGELEARDVGGAVRIAVTDLDGFMWSRDLWEPTGRVEQ